MACFTRICRGVERGLSNPSSYRAGDASKTIFYFKRRQVVTRLRQSSVSEKVRKFGFVPLCLLRMGSQNIPAQLNSAGEMYNWSSLPCHEKYIMQNTLRRLYLMRCTRWWLTSNLATIQDVSSQCYKLFSWNGWSLGIHWAASRGFICEEGRCTQT